MNRLVILLFFMAFGSALAMAQNPGPCENVTNSATTGQTIRANSAGTAPPCSWTTPAAGTVTSVTCGTGLTGGTITVTGTCAVDDTVMRTNQSNTVTTGTQDQTAAIHTLPVKTGVNASKPATCTVGELYFATDATPGQNTYYCTATNVWTQQLDTSGGNGALGYSGAALATVTGTVYCAISGGGVCSVTESNVQQQSATQSTATAFAGTISQALGGGNSVALTLRKCTPSSGACTGSDQSVTCTISGASATGCLDAAHSFAISQGDYLSVKLVFSGTVLVNPALSSQTQIGTTTSAGSVNTGAINQSACYTAAGTAVSGVTGSCGGANAVNASITASSLGAQAVCALHTDTGCGNATDATSANCAGTNPTTDAPCLFSGSITIPANALGSSVTSLQFLLGTLSTATVPTGIVRIFFDAILVYSGATNAGIAGTRSQAFMCLVSGQGSGASAPIALACNSNGNFAATGTFGPNSLNNNATPAIAVDTTVSHVVRYGVVYSAATTLNMAWSYGMRFTQ